MAHEQAASAPQLRLPTLVFGRVEVRRLKRELQALEDFIRQSQIREPGKQAALPRLSRLLDGLATDNGLQLLQPDHREALKQLLTAVEKQALVVHMSFAVDPSSAFTSKMVSWLRGNIHPYALLEVGLQPTIAAGCIVRTPNKVFDFSLRERFADAEGLLLQALDAANASFQPAGVVPAPAQPDGTPATAPEQTTAAPVAAAAVSPPAAQPAPAPQGVQA